VTVRSGAATAGRPGWDGAPPHHRHHAACQPPPTPSGGSARRPATRS